MNRNYFRPFLFIMVLLIIKCHYSSAFYGENDKNDENENEIDSSDAFDQQSFYEILDVTRRSTENAIRRAFKKSAMRIHPDKHRNDVMATKKFRRLQLAYEVLLDSNLRQIYDQSGEDAVKQFMAQHHRSPPSFEEDDDESKGQIGLYDRDAAITKFDDTSFRALVLGGGGGKKWFVNFYHTDCEPCHAMADEWRRFARQMDGVIGVGAVNCKEHGTLCSDMNIGLYPGLIVFPEGEVYLNEERTSEKFIEFVLSVINPSGNEIADAILEPGKPYLIDACDDTSGFPINCLSNDTLKLLALRLFASGSSVGVKSVSFQWKPELRRLFKDEDDGLYYSEAFGTEGFEKRIDSSDVDEILAFIGKQAPDFVDLVWPKMLQLIEHGRIGADVSQWLVIFEDGASKMKQDYHELRSLIGGHSLKIGRFDCDESPSICERFPSVYLETYPAFAIFKPNMGHEFFKGDYKGATYTIRDVAVWAAGVSANNYKSLDGAELIEIVSNRNSDEIWLVSVIFTPAELCPECAQLKSGFQDLAKLEVGYNNSKNPIRFGLIDCRAYYVECEASTIHTFPQTILFNGTSVSAVSGGYNSTELKEFFEKVETSHVARLTSETVEDWLDRQWKPNAMLGIIFVTPYHPQCSRLSALIRNIAAMALKFPDAVSVDLRFAEMDCSKSGRYCLERLGVGSYPSARVYPVDNVAYSNNYSSYYKSGHFDHEHFAKWLFSFSDLDAFKLKKLGETFALSVSF